MNNASATTTRPVPALLAAAVLLLTLASPVVALVVASVTDARAATYQVDTSADDASKTGCSDDVAGDCSLRGAIAKANGDAAQDTIVVPAGTYPLSVASPCFFAAASGDSENGIMVAAVCVNSNVDLVGAGADQTIIQSGGTDRLFAISKLKTVSISGVTLTGGRGGFGYAIGGGGAINNHGTLMLSDSVLTNNQSNFGGAIYNLGKLTVVRSTITGNTASSGGGAINNTCCGGPITVTVIDSTIASNGAQNGGGINNNGLVTVIGSTLSGNTANSGGGIANFGGNVTVRNSTLSGNTGGGGALAIGLSSPDGASVVRLESTTIANNAGTPYGGGLYIVGTQPVTLRNTIVAGNTTSGGYGPDCGGRIVSEGYNLIQSTANCQIVGDTTGNITGVPARLGALADNGGSTRTRAPLPADQTNAASPAIDAGNPAAPGSGGTSCAAIDQRGNVRPVGVRCDIGAVESVAGFAVARVLPARGGAGGTVLLHVAGSGIEPGATLQLEQAGQPVIVADAADADEGRSALTATVDLATAAQGAWDVVVTNPGGESRRLDAAFTVEPARTADVWMYVVGPSGMRAGVPTLFTLVYGNRGNVDALDVPITLSLAAGMGYHLIFPFGAPPIVDPAIELDWQLQDGDVDAGADSGTTNLAFLLPVVPAGSTSSLQFQMTLPPTLPHGAEVTSFAGTGAPLLTPEPSQQTIDAIVAGARAYALEKLFVTIPDSAVPELAERALQQLDAVADEGRALLVQTGGVGQRVHSLAWIQLELALHGAKAVLESAASASLSRQRLVAELTGLFQARDAFALTLREGCPIVACAKSPPLDEGCFCIDMVCDGKARASDGGCYPPPLPGPPGCEIHEKMQISEFLANLQKCRMDKNRCEALPDHHVHTNDDGSQFCVPDGPSNHCPVIQIPNPLGAGSLDCLGTPIKNSHDPNEKTGVTGIGAAHFLRQGTALAYTVSFENDPALASAPAQVVTITDQLDPAKVDLSTFALGAMSFGNQLVPVPPGAQQFTGGVDLRPAQNLIVLIDAGLDPVTGLVHWTFTSVDPTTMQLTTDPDAGFLPPNVTPPEGDGTVSFTVKPNPGLPAGATICNEASIIFDVNDPIVTPTWCNGFDESPPVTAVASATVDDACDTSLDVAWSGSDAGAGVIFYSVYVSTNGGPFTLWQESTTATSATFSGTSGNTYAFYSIGSDSLGNTEVAPATADVTRALGVCGTENDLAIVKLKAPKTVKLTATKPTKAITIAVDVQNRSRHVETIPDDAALAALVDVTVHSAGACADVTASLRPAKKPKAIALKPGQKRKVVFDASFGCTNDAAKGAGHTDFWLSAHVDHAALGGSDAHPADDDCPRTVTPPGVLDPFPAKPVLDKGCGEKKPDKTFGGAVLVDVVGP